MTTEQKVQNIADADLDQVAGGMTVKDFFKDVWKGFKGAWKGFGKPGPMMRARLDDKDWPQKK